MRKFDQGEYLLQKTSLGWIGAATSKNGLAAIILPQREIADVAARLHEDFVFLKETGNDLLLSFMEKCGSYFSGRKGSFEGLEIDCSWATPFSLEVYRKVQNIPYGELRTYKEVALDVGNYKASRAIGGAMRRNKLPLIIPCHRVVGSNGLGGFTGAGLDLKQRLIQLERGLRISS